LEEIVPPAQADVKTSRGQPWRALIAAVAGAAAGSVAGFVFVTCVDFLDERLLSVVLPSVDRAHPTAKLAVIFGILMAILFLGGWLVMLGSATFAYRKIRGKLLPNVGSHTRCGWCQHELHGITSPICPECGHRIGDRGPDEFGELPRARRRLRRIGTWLLLTAFAFAVYIPVGLITPLVMLALRYLKHRETVDQHAVGRLMLSFTVFGEFVGLFTALLYYEAVLQFRMKFSGRAWCRVCRSELAKLEQPVCPTCGTCI
jgi:hypothetical protein